MLSKPFFKICVTSVTKLNDLYTTIPSTEIWSTHLVDNTLNQIKYYAQGGMFKTKSDIIIIINQLSSLMKDLQAAAKTGHKSFKDGRIGSSFNLYHNEITHTNNVILPKLYGNESYRFLELFFRMVFQITTTFPFSFSAIRAKSTHFI
jgi:hypothetical protein